METDIITNISASLMSVIVFIGDDFYVRLTDKLGHASYELT